MLLLSFRHVPAAAFLGTFSVWHERLFHIFHPILQKVLSSCNINVIKPSHGGVCEPCKLTKPHKKL